MEDRRRAVPRPRVCVCFFFKPRIRIVQEHFIMANLGKYHLSPDAMQKEESEG